MIINFFSLNCGYFILPLMNLQTVAYLGRGIMPWLPLDINNSDRAQEIRDRFKVKTFFLDITMFLAPKTDKTETGSK